MASALDEEINVVRPHFDPSSTREESSAVKSILASLSLIPHIEGGYYAVTDVSETKIPSPYPNSPLSQATIDLIGGLPQDFDYALRRLSTTIFYYLTPARPTGFFHRNRSRIIHSLQHGRGRYVLIHPDGRVESFVVGKDIEKGEKLQWVVEGDVWKASFLLPDASEDGQEENQGLLISETVVPGFEFADHEFLTDHEIYHLVNYRTAKRIDWLLKPE